MSRFLAFLLATLSVAAGAGAFAALERAPFVADQDAAIAELLRLGRARLAAGEPDQALPFLEEADALSGGRLPARKWLIRCWIARGYLNDALDATDELREAGASGASLDYLYGLALHARASEYIRLRAGGLVEMNFRDAADFLRKATRADPEEHGDAFLPLAESAWYAQDLATARAAADVAAARRPEGLAEAWTLGRVAFSQFTAIAADEQRAEEADAHWTLAKESFERAIRLAGEPEEAARRSFLARVHVQAAHVLVWKELADDAALHFAAAMAWDPSALDYRSLWTYLDAPGVLRCLERGSQGFARIHGASASGDATLLWWLGWASLALEKYEEAERAYTLAVAKEPAFAESHFYVGLARYHRQDYDGAIEAMVRGWHEGSQAVTGAASENADRNLAMLRYLVDRCAGASPPRNRSAAALAEIYTSLAPQDALFWSYVGLFHRDAGDELRASRREEDGAKQREHYERALAGYERALELEPGNPAYLNDGAVVLHYCLRRELDRARDMYLLAAERAEEELARADLEPGLRAIYETARRDSRSNLARLERERPAPKKD